MTRKDMQEILAVATATRDFAYEAYQTALQNRRNAGDTETAYQALLRANRVRDMIYNHILASV